ncbi:MAG: YggT family protein [Gammaproteobacteria bacterium]
MTALLFILNLVGTLLVGIFIMRFLLQLVRADFYNPVSQAIVNLTNPLVMPLRKVIPGLKGLDLASLVAAAIVQVIVLLALYFIQTGRLPGVQYTLVESFFSLLNLVFRIYIMTIFLRVILSWVNPDPRNPIVSMLYSLTEPVLAPARRMIPSIGGLDLSPLVVLLLLQALQILINSDIRGMF